MKKRTPEGPIYPTYPERPVIEVGNSWSTQLVTNITLFVKATSPKDAEFIAERERGLSPHCAGYHSGRKRYVVHLLQKREEFVPEIPF